VTKIADFGIAKSAATPHTMTGQIIGTMAYLSADRIAGRPATAADDIYAVGVVGYEALTGHRAFPQENLAELARAISEQRPVPLAVLRPDVEPGLGAVIDRAMAREPQRRFDSANSMRAALAARVDPPAVGHVAPPVVDRPATRVMTSPLPAPPSMMVRPPQVRRSRTRLLLSLAAAVVALVIAAAAVIADSTSRSPAPASTSTPVPTPVTTSVLAPLTTTPPVPVDQGPPGQHKGEDGENGNPKRPKGDGDDD
jgi:serine/threonine-protein kinase